MFLYYVIINGSSEEEPPNTVRHELVPVWEIEKIIALLSHLLKSIEFLMFTRYPTIASNFILNAQHFKLPRFIFYMFNISTKKVAR